MKNRKAFFNYEILEKFTAGIQLKGTEVKSIRAGKLDFSDSYCAVKETTVLWRNGYIDEYKEGIEDHGVKRDRKLLLNKKEIEQISKYLETKGLSLIPLEITYVNNKYKLVIGVGKGKKNYDKREAIKKRDLKRPENQ